MTNKKEELIEKKILTLLKKLSKKEKIRFIDWLKFDNSWRGY